MDIQKIYLRVNLRLNMNQWGAFTDLLCEHLPDPTVVEMHVETPEERAEFKNEDAVPMPAAKTKKHRKRGPNRNGTRNAVTGEAYKMVHALVKEDPLIQNNKIRDIIAQRLGVLYGKSTISDIRGRHPRYHRAEMLAEEL